MYMKQTLFYIYLSENKYMYNFHFLHFLSFEMRPNISIA